ncbi:CPBP family intramembrane metalloprotease [Candidatus Saccharibacteria bacterium]|nr:CPBP family intramembrane metalloprotease [Candidatus Saccharibacteria bacterium]
MIISKNKKLTTVLILHTIFFFLIWTVCETWLKSQLFVCQEEWFREIVLKTIVWTIPALLLIRTFSGSLAIDIKEMLTKHVNWASYTPLFALFSVYLIVSAFVVSGVLGVSPQFSLLTVFIVLSIGVAEELVFRGWLLNATLRLFGYKRKWFAILLNAFMFLCIHFPLWLYTGTFYETFANFGFVIVLALSIIFSLVFIKSRSIWPPVMLHAYWNLLMIVFL